MTDARRPITRFPGLVLALAVLMGCADESTEPTDDDGSTDTGSTTFHAFFLDDAVNGLRYRSGDGPMRTTDVYGACELTVGQPATFYVDDVALGTVASPTTRITPNSFGVSGTSIARFVQSLDTTPGVPGIELSNVDLAPDPIDFAQGNDAFGMDPLVLQAVTDAEKVGGTGILVTPSQASQALAAGLSTVFETSDFADRAFFPIVAGAANEPCVVRTRADGTGVNVCQDDIDATPGSTGVPFSWFIDGDAALVVEIDYQGLEERVLVQRLGTTGNRISTQVTSECLSCNPDEGPVTELTAETVLMPLPIADADFDGRTILFTVGSEVSTATFNADGTGTLAAGGELTSFDWAIGEILDDVLVIRGTGTPGEELLYVELFLVDGGVTAGRFAALSGAATDVNANGVLDDTDIEATLVYDAVELVTSSR